MSSGVSITVSELWALGGEEMRRGDRIAGMYTSEEKAQEERDRLLVLGVTRDSLQIQRIPIGAIDPVLEPSWLVEFTKDYRGAVRIRASKSAFPFDPDAGHEWNQWDESLVVRYPGNLAQSDVFTLAGMRWEDELAAVWSERKETRYGDEEGKAAAVDQASNE